MKKLFLYISAVIILQVSGAFVFAGDVPDEWKDLDEGEHKIFGSEKELKFKHNKWIFEVEDWENHYSKKIFWLYKDKDYPRYTYFRFWPFGSTVKSKIDNRRRTWTFPLFGFYYHWIDKREDTTYFFPWYYMLFSELFRIAILLYYRREI